MKIIVTNMAIVLLAAFMVAVYGFVAIEPDALEIAGLLTGLAISPIVLGYGYKLLNAMAKGLTTKSKVDEEPIAVTSIPMELPYDVGTKSFTPYREPVENLPAFHSSPASMEMELMGSPVERSLTVTELGERADTTACPFCGETILKVAKKCKHCGEFLDPLLRQQATAMASQPGVHVQVIRETPSHPPETSNAVAVICSFFWPGLGQMVQGRVGAGIVWMIGVFLGYLFFIVPGFILHLVCLLDASQYKPQRS